MEPHVVLGFDSRLAHRLFASHFGEHNVTVEAHGNSLAAAAFCKGLRRPISLLHSWTPTKKVATDFARRSASRWSSSPIHPVFGARVSPGWSPTSASAPPIPPTGARSRGDRLRTRSPGCRPRGTLLATSPEC